MPCCVHFEVIPVNIPPLSTGASAASASAAAVTAIGVGIVAVATYYAVKKLQKD
jgi:hypothetical protein